jgi:hypothetical protein
VLKRRGLIFEREVLLTHCLCTFLDQAGRSNTFGSEFIIFGARSVLRSQDFALGVMAVVARKRGLGAGFERGREALPLVKGRSPI